MSKRKTTDKLWIGIDAWGRSGRRRRFEVEVDWPEMEVKPCPFCGEEPRLDREEISCDCGVKMPIPLYVWGVGDCEGFPDFQTAKAEMIEAWNRRVEP